MMKSYRYVVALLRVNAEKSVHTDNDDEEDEDDDVFVVIVVVNIHKLDSYKNITISENLT